MSLSERAHEKRELQLIFFSVFFPPYSTIIMRYFLIEQIFSHLFRGKKRLTLVLDFFERIIFFSIFLLKIKSHIIVENERNTLNEISAIIIINFFLFLEAKQIYTSEKADLITRLFLFIIFFFFFLFAKINVIVINNNNNKKEKI